ncbi:MAG: transposase [Verrucomicrobiae bacterium]|nr:transposase [Verrucomicrobiae bacterium]
MADHVDTTTETALTVIAVLRRFLPAFRKFQWLPVYLDRAIWAILYCRTVVMGGHIYHCEDCDQWKFIPHSCNHRSCPQCGRGDTARWVERELAKRVGAPYFMVTFTLPEELRALFFGPQERLIHDLFFTASSRALADTLAMDKALRAQRSGFTGVLHTWNQRLHFHPHIHYIVPGAGIDEHGGGVTVKSANFLVPLPILREAFRRHFQSGWEELKQTPHWQKNKWRYERRGKLEPDPGVWDKDWGVHIKPFGDGANAIKYLGRYVCRSAISDARIVAIGDDDTVTFRWKDRAQQNRQRTETIPGETFVMRYLQHVLPSGVRAIRRFGFCHPAAKAARERIAFHTGKTLHIGPTLAEAVAAAGNTDTGDGIPHPPCPCCQRPMARIEGAFNKLPCEVRKILLTQLRAPPATQVTPAPLST